MRQERREDCAQHLRHRGNASDSLPTTLAGNSPGRWCHRTDIVRPSSPDEVTSYGGRTVVQMEFYWTLIVACFLNLVDLFNPTILILCMTKKRKGIGSRSLDLFRDQKSFRDQFDSEEEEEGKAIRMTVPQTAGWLHLLTSELSPALRKEVGGRKHSRFMGCR